MRHNEWGRCVCGCRGLAFPRGDDQGDLETPMVVVWPPGAQPAGVAEEFTDVSKARVVVYPGEAQAVRGEFDTLEEAKAWGLAIMRMEGDPP